MAKMTQSKGMKNICAVGFVVSLMSPPLRRDWARPSPRGDDTRKAEPRYPVVPADIQLTADTWGGVAQTSRTEMLPVVYHWGCLLPSIIVVRDNKHSYGSFGIWFELPVHFRCDAHHLSQFETHIYMTVSWIHSSRVMRRSEGGLREYLLYCVSSGRDATCSDQSFSLIQV